MHMTFHNWTTLHTVLLIGLLLAGWGGQVAMGSESARTQNQQSATGVLLGRVTRSPMVPVERSDRPVPPGPVAGARILVSDLVGNQVATVMTDEHGEYRVDLPAGDYRVDMVRVGRFGLTKDLPATVTIRPGRETRLDVGVDSGIR
jgi:hypothetical protein